MRIEDYLARFDTKSADQGRELRFDCPFCDDGKRRFFVRTRSIPNHLRGYCQCFHCGFRTRSFVHFVAKLEQTSLKEAFLRVSGEGQPVGTPNDALAEFKAAIGFDPFQEEPSVPAFVSEPKGLALPRCFLPIKFPSHPAFESSCYARMSYHYLKSRGLTKEDIRLLYDIRYCVKLGSPYFGHVIFPITELGSLVYWTSRRFNSQSKHLRKSENPMKADVNGRGKSDVVFGLDLAVASGPSVTITEGPFDAMVVGPDAVALMGKTMSDVQRSKILSGQFDRINIMLDADATKNAYEIAEKLRSHAPVRTRIAVIDLLEITGDARTDPASLGRARCREIINGAKSSTGLELALSRLVGFRTDDLC